jgi:hypothetical protein
LFGVFGGLFHCGGSCNGIEGVEVCHGEFESADPVLDVGLAVWALWCGNFPDGGEITS